MIEPVTVYAGIIESLTSAVTPFKINLIHNQSTTAEPQSQPRHAGLQDPLQWILRQIQPILRVPARRCHLPELRHTRKRPRPRPPVEPHHHWNRFLWHRRRRLWPLLVGVTWLPPHRRRSRRFFKDLRSLSAAHLKPYPLPTRARSGGPWRRLQYRSKGLLFERLLGWHGEVVDCGQANECEDIQGTRLLCVLRRLESPACRHFCFCFRGLYCAHLGCPWTRYPSYLLFVISAYCCIPCFESCTLMMVL